MTTFAFECRLLNVHWLPFSIIIAFTFCTFNGTEPIVHISFWIFIEVMAKTIQTNWKRTKLNVCVCFFPLKWRCGRSFILKLISSVFIQSECFHIKHSMRCVHSSIGNSNYFFWRHWIDENALLEFSFIHRKYNYRLLLKLIIFVLNFFSRFFPLQSQKCLRNAFFLAFFRVLFRLWFIFNYSSQIHLVSIRIGFLIG